MPKHSKRQLRLAGLLDLEYEGKAWRVHHRSTTNRYRSWGVNIGQGPWPKEFTVHVGSADGFRIGRVVSESRSGQDGPLDMILRDLGAGALEEGRVKVEELPEP